MLQHSRTATRYGSDTILPEGIEAVPKRYAISWRNKWMIELVEYVVTYVSRSFCVAANVYEQTLKIGIKALNIPPNAMIKLSLFWKPYIDN